MTDAQYHDHHDYRVLPYSEQVIPHCDKRVVSCRDCGRLCYVNERDCRHCGERMIPPTISSSLYRPGLNIMPPGPITNRPIADLVADDIERGDAKRKKELRVEV